MGGEDARARIVFLVPAVWNRPMSIKEILFLSWRSQLRVCAEGGRIVDFG